MEIDKKPLGDDRALLDASRDFTVLIKNQIEFPYYDARRTNILECVEHFASFILENHAIEIKF